MNKANQGAKANHTGVVAEETVADILRRRSFHVSCQHRTGTKGISGGEIVADCYVFADDRLPDGLIVECKWQEVAGTADEKLLYLAENILACYPCPTVIICAGGGARHGMVKHIKGKVDNKRLLGVFGLDEFLIWARNL